MKRFKLSTNILLVSIFVLVVFSLASFGILFRALSSQAEGEMDQLLKNESLALSALVNSSAGGHYEFEMHPSFMRQYQQRNPNGFFRFLDKAGTVLRESIDAPTIGCTDSSSNLNVQLGNEIYRIEALNFSPEFDSEAEESPKSLRLPICLVVGINRSPYWKVLVETLFSSVPILIAIMVLLVTALLFLIRGFTRDLLVLTSALTTANFGGTHAFPVLPKPKTREVKAIVDVLEVLHLQASEVYREMWLFMGRAAHQIKTPVTAMQATLDVLLRKDRTKDELLSGLQDVKSAALLLSGLTKKLISSSRISHQAIPPTETVDLKTFFDDLISLFHYEAESKNVSIVLPSPHSLKVTANRELMSDIFSNLIENAIIYSAKATPSEVSIEWSQMANQVFIQIRDQGPGFPAQVIATLFSPFIRGDERKVAGSGLGLSIAKKSAMILGGDIELSESTTAGSILRVTLPLGSILEI